MRATSVFHSFLCFHVAYGWERKREKKGEGREKKGEKEEREGEGHGKEERGREEAVL